MTTTELIALLKKYEHGGATGRPREIYFQLKDEIIDTDKLHVTGTGDGLFTELFIRLDDDPDPEDEIEAVEAWNRRANNE